MSAIYAFFFIEGNSYTLTDIRQFEDNIGSAMIDAGFSDTNDFLSEITKYFAS